MTRNATVVIIQPRGGWWLDPGECYFLFHADEPEPRQPAGIVHACPCGCGARSAIWFRGRGRGRAEWDVVGDWPKVTLRPSIGIKPVIDGRYHWHGYLEAGVFVER